jgi:NhaP-type Na+/H+ or K+/H+ antiporter
MRGIVTLAAALALPTGNDGVPPFPYRDLILFTAFAVVLGTLVVQGVTLRPLMARLRLEEDDTVEREVKLARTETLRAALTATQANTDRTAFVRQWYELQLRRTERGNAPEVWGPADADLVRTGMQAERHRLSELRAAGVIGDAAFQRVEQELDLAELGLQQLLLTERD